VIDLPTAHALGAHLGALHGATVAAWDSPISRALRLGLDVAASVPGVGTLLDAARLRDPRISRCLPGPLVLLSEDTHRDPVTYAEAVARELQHAVQLAEVGQVQGAIDYLGSGELRAARAAEAYLCGLWVRYLCTWHCPQVDDAMADLGSGLYHLDAGEVELARGIVTSGVETIRAGLAPPYTICAEALGWLSLHAPHAILAQEHRP
jgi:hypothetical protein